MSIFREYPEAKSIFMVSLRMSLTKSPEISQEVRCAIGLKFEQGRRADRLIMNVL